MLGEGSPWVMRTIFARNIYIWLFFKHRSKMIPIKYYLIEYLRNKQDTKNNQVCKR